MTAPAVVAPAAPATTGAPSVGGAETSVMDTAIEKIAQRRPALVDAPNAPIENRGEQEPFAPAEPQVADAPAESVDGQAPIAAEGEPAAAPSALTTEIKAEDGDGEVVLRARDPETGKFADMDQTRTYELSLKDKATGEVKVYQKTLPDLMRLAKDGISTQKFQNEVKQSAGELSYYRDNVPKWEATFAETEQKAAAYEALALELLSGSPDTVISYRDQYAADQSPERQLARHRAEVDAERERLASEKQQWQFTRQIEAATSRMAPVVNQVEQLVGPNAAAGFLARNTAHLLVNGVIPPEHHPQLIAFIEGPYLQWAQQEAASRSGSTAETAKLAEAARRAQATNQQLVNQTGRLSAPAGQSRSGEGARKPFSNVNEAIEGISLRR